MNSITFSYVLFPFLKYRLIFLYSSYIILNYLHLIFSSYNTAPLQHTRKISLIVDSDLINFRLYCTVIKNKRTNNF